MCSVLPVYCQCITRALTENRVARETLDITSVVSKVIYHSKNCVARVLTEPYQVGLFLKGSTIVGFSLKLKGICQFEHKQSLTPNQNKNLPSGIPTCCRWSVKVSKY